MLYLAEVIIKRQELPWVSTHKLNLLAYQQDSQNWSILSKQKTITIKESCCFPKGTLVTVNIVDEQQNIEKIELAKPCILKIIRDFSTILEKHQKQQHKIEEWKQSLEYQFKELERQKRQLENQQIKSEKDNKSTLYSDSNPDNVNNVEAAISSRKLLGQILQEANLLSDAQLELALRTQADYPELKIGKILALRGWIKLKTVDFFAQYWLNLLKEEKNYPLGFYLTQAGILNNEQINIILAEQKELKLRLGEIAILKGWLNKKTLNYFLENLLLEHGGRVTTDTCDFN